jgi:pyridoxine 5-phosphate synthase
MPLARKLGVHRVELYTEPYGAAAAEGHGARALPAYVAAAAAARAEGLGVNAGHDLSLANLAAFLAAVRPVDEVSIGHALIADALELGLAETVRRYAALCAGA